MKVVSVDTSSGKSETSRRSQKQDYVVEIANLKQGYNNIQQ